MKKLLFMCLCVCMILPIGTFAQSADTDDQKNTDITAQESSEAVNDSDIVFDPDTDWSAPEPLNNDVSCFDYYKFQSVSVSVGPDQLEYQPGSTVQFTGTIYNENDYPIFDGSLFVRIGKKNDNAFTEGQYTVDEFIAVEDIAINAKSEKSVEFTWDVPLYRDNGTYIVDYFFSAGKKYTLGGLSFSNEILAGTASFDISSTITDFVSFEKSKTLFNGEPYQHIGSWPNVPAGSDVVITNFLRNSFDYEKIVNITQELYRWDALHPDDKISEKTYPLTIPADTTQEITYTVPETSDAVYYIRTTATYDEDVHSIITTRFSTDATRARLNFPALTKFPLEKGDAATLFTCFHNTTISGTKGTVHVIAHDHDGNVIDEVSYDGEITSAMSAIKKDLTAQKKYDYVKLHATITDESGKTVDSYDVIYDCEKIGMCAQEQKHSLWSTMLRWCAYILFVGVSIVIIIVLINMLRKKHLRGVKLSIVITLLVCGFACGHTVDAVGETSWAESHNYTLRQLGDNALINQVQSLVSTGNVTLKHNMGASTLTPECNGSVKFTYTPTITYNASGGDIGTPNGTFCNNSFPNCFTNISTVGQKISTGTSSSAYGYLHWTAIKPTVTLSSDNPSLMTCSGMTCTAAPGKSGTVTITATTSKTQGRIWANVSVDRAKYKDAMSKITPGSVLGMARVPKSGRVWYSPTEDTFRCVGTSSGTGKLDYGYAPSFKTIDFKSTNTAQWEITIGPCETKGECNTAATRLDYPFTATGPSTPLCAPTSGSPSPATVSFPSGQYGAASKVIWTCNGLNGGQNSPPCEAARLAPAAACGTAAGVTTSVQPSMNLCGAGTTLVNPPGVHLEGSTWRWSCRHNIVGAVPQVAECSASAPRTEGQCNTMLQSIAWNVSPETFTSSLCSSGTADADMSTETIDLVPFPEIGQTVTWGCRGLFGGLSTAANACSVSRPCPNVSCGEANGTSANTKPTTNLCSSGAPLIDPPGVTMDSGGYWGWSCKSPANVSACPDAACRAESCLVGLPYELQPYVYFDGDGTPNDATMTVTCPNVCCNVDGAEGTVTVCNGTPGQIPVRPGQNVYDMECWFDDGNRSKDDDENGVQKSSPISTMCSARSCNNQGTCQATPTVSNSADGCTSTCNSDADCSRGRMIETRP